MTKNILKEREIIKILKGHPMFFIMMVHVIFTIVLFIAMTHMRMQLSGHIAQQQRENEELKKILKSYGNVKSRNEEMNNKINDMHGLNERNKFQNKAGESKEVIELDESEEGETIPQLILRNKRNSQSKCCAEKGQRGKKGQKGSRGKRGRKGVQGEKGDSGMPGAKGNKGDRGLMGLNGHNGQSGAPGMLGLPGKNGDKGSKGDKGELGFRLAQSAHIVGRGGSMKQHRDNVIGYAFLLKSWTVNHFKGQMIYSNGYLNVGQTGYYYIYCQLHSTEGHATIYSFSLYIDNIAVITSVQSIINSTKRYNTDYIGGLFQIQAGQKISVRTPYNNTFKFSRTGSFFGAFMIHP